MDSTTREIDSLKTQMRRQGETLYAQRIALRILHGAVAKTSLEISKEFMTEPRAAQAHYASRGEKDLADDLDGLIQPL